MRLFRKIGFGILPSLCILSSGKIHGHGIHKHNVLHSSAVEISANDSTLQQENLGKKFSWTNPDLEAMLWGGAHNVPLKDSGNHLDQVMKRAGREIGPAISFDCIFCVYAGGKPDNSHLTIDDFDMHKMIARAFQPVRGDIPCIFYQQRPPGKDPFTLSEIATEYACANNLRSIWMMWPYNAESCGETNYYCLYDTCCWLHPILGTGSEDEKQKKRLEYFTAMSLAIANTCRGDVYIMSDNVDRVPTSPFLYPFGDQVAKSFDGKKANPSIWLNDEIRMLRELKELGLVDKFYSISVDGKAKRDQSEVLTYSRWPLPLYNPLGKREDKVTLANETEYKEMGKKIESESLAKKAYMRKLISIGLEVEKEYLALPQEERIQLEEEARISRRGSSCSGACAYQPRGDDWFG